MYILKWRLCCYSKAGDMFRRKKVKENIPSPFLLMLNIIRMKKISIVYGFLFILMACNSKPANVSAAREEMMETDRQFSALSEREGMKKAFLQFIDSGGILLRPDHYPLVGKEAMQFLSASHDSSFTLTWEPQAGEVSASADLGYTYGVYRLEMADTTSRGTYVSIWKKQTDGSWKYVLDTGNPGLGNK